jgi:hypothetical protein
MALLSKKNIAFAIIPNDDDGLTRDHRYNFSKPQVLNVKLSVADFEMKGDLEITCKPELKVILTSGTSTFMTLFDAVAVHSTHPDVNMRGSAIIINKSMMDYFGLCGNVALKSLKQAPIKV